jgi:hypothetical protein
MFWPFWLATILVLIWGIALGLTTPTRPVSSDHGLLPLKGRWLVCAFFGLLLVVLLASAALLYLQLGNPL